MIFLDTNILLYAYDLDEESKRQTAKGILANCWNNRSGAVSTQVLQEFYVTLTRKLPKKLTANEAREIIRDFLPWPIYQVAPTDIVKASELEEKSGYTFWDSLVITAAQNTNAEILYSEDMQDGQQFGGLKIINPFN
jgi:predicted nucleic acid-binding protein